MATTLLCLKGVTTGRGPAASLRCLGDDDLQERYSHSLASSSSRSRAMEKIVHMEPVMDVKHDAQRLGKACPTIAWST